LARRAAARRGVGPAQPGPGRDGGDLALLRRPPEARRVGMAGTLFVVGTPIGNVGDLSARAAATLAAVDVIACEDTRRTGRLLQRLGVRARLLSLYEGNEDARVPELVKILDDDVDVAVVTDAGMPG